MGGLLAITLVGGAKADLHFTYAQQASVAGAPTAYSLRDIAVNRNVGSPYYGYVYATDVTGSKVHILRPARPEDASGSAGLVDSGLTITASAGSSNLFGVAVGADDTVWLGVFGTGYIETAPPVPPVDNDVISHRQFMVTGGIRGIAAAGTLADAQVWIQTNDVKVKRWTGGTTAWDATGTFSEVKVTDLRTISANVQVGYGLGADSAGNAYAGLSYNAAGADVPLVAKVKPDGSIDADWGGKRPAFTSIANSLADAEVVEDPSLPGGGYVYYGARQVTAAVNKRIVHRYRLDNGAWLDSFGPAAASGFTPPTDATYTVLDVDNTNQPHYFGADDKGNLYLNSGTLTKVTKVAASQPFVVAAGQTNSADGAVRSSPTAVDGVVYFGSDDGKLYAYTAADGNPVPGFPVDAAEVVGAGAKILSRPAVYITDAGKGIYFTTDTGYLGRVNADGSGLTTLKVFDGSVDGVNNVGTPAVLPDGTVYVGLTTTGGSGVVKVAPGPSVAFSATLGDAGSSITSVAVYGNRIYVGLTGGNNGDIAVLNASDLTILGGFAAGEGVTAPPYVSAADAYVATRAGNFYKVNSATLAPDLSFGALNVPPTPGMAAIGEPLSTSPFQPRFGPFLAGSDKGKVFTIRPDTGEFQVFYDTGEATSAIGGLVATSNTLGFGTSAGAFYVVPSNGQDAQVYRGHGAFSSTPTYDAGTRRFIIGSEDKNVYTFPTPVVPPID
jgi:hypothetical protein